MNTQNNGVEAFRTENNIEKKKRGRPAYKPPPPEERDPNLPECAYGKYRHQYIYDAERRKIDEEYKKKKYEKQNKINSERYKNDPEFRERIKRQSMERRKRVEAVYKAHLETQKNT